MKCGGQEWVKIRNPRGNFKTSFSHDFAINDFAYISQDWGKQRDGKIIDGKVRRSFAIAGSFPFSCVWRVSRALIPYSAFRTSDLCPLNTLKHAKTGKHPYLTQPYFF